MTTKITNSAEQQATEIGNSLILLRQRLDDAVSGYVEDVRKKFTPRTSCRLDFKNKRLYAVDGGCFFQWKLRACPELPIGQYNEQHPTGIVSFFGMIEAQ